MTITAPPQTPHIHTNLKGQTQKPQSHTHKTLMEGDHLQSLMVLKVPAKGLCSYQENPALLLPGRAAVLPWKHRDFQHCRFVAPQLEWKFQVYWRTFSFVCHCLSAEVMKFWTFKQNLRPSTSLFFSNQEITWKQLCSVSSPIHTVTFMLLSTPDYLRSKTMRRFERHQLGIIQQCIHYLLAKKLKTSIYFRN